MSLEIKDSKVIGFLGSMDTQARSNSTQAATMMAASDTNLSATLVGDHQAGSKQIPPEDAHYKIIELLRIEIALNLHNILAQEVNGIGGQDYTDLLGVISTLGNCISANSSFMEDAKARIKASRGQFADILATNAVHMSSGNHIEILSANEFRVLRTAMWRAGTALRWEAPLIIDNAHTRITLAHSLLQEAELLSQRAISLLASVKEVYGVTAQEIILLAQDNLFGQANTITLLASGGASIIMSNGQVNINPTTPPAGVSLSSLNVPAYRTRAKKHLELPQFDGMSPIPAYTTPDDEVQIQKTGEANA